MYLSVNTAIPIELYNAENFLPPPDTQLELPNSSSITIDSNEVNFIQ